jgi:hypothetical protein
MCPALAFGPEADQAAQESHARYMNENCGGALAAAEVGLNFTDVTKEVFASRYSKGTAAALAVISGQPLPSIIALPIRQIKTGSYSGFAGRRLQQDNIHPTNKVLTVYQIRSAAADAPEVLRRLNLAGANKGEGLFKALAANGVPLKPSFSIQNGPPLVGAVPRRNYKPIREEAMEPGEIAGIVIGSVGGAGVLGGLIAFGAAHLKNRKSKGAEAAAAAGKGAEEGKGGKVIDVAAKSTEGAAAAAAAESK